MDALGRLMHRATRTEASFGGLSDDSPTPWQDADPLRLIDVAPPGRHSRELRPARSRTPPCVGQTAIVHDPRDRPRVTQRRRLSSEEQPTRATCNRSAPRFFAEPGTPAGRVHRLEGTSPWEHRAATRWPHLDTATDSALEQDLEVGLTREGGQRTGGNTGAQTS
jgi:hypothetical protein